VAHGATGGREVGGLLWSQREEEEVETCKGEGKLAVGSVGAAEERVAVLAAFRKGKKASGRGGCCCSWGRGGCCYSSGCGGREEEFYRGEREVVQPPREMVWWLLEVGMMVRRQMMVVVVAEVHHGERKKRKGWLQENP